MTQYATDLSESERHRVLASGRRRTVLNIIVGQTGPLELEDLATEVARAEFDGQPSTEATVGRVLASLHHRHLPILDEFGVVDYDSECKQVAVVATAPRRLVGHP
ncbi:MULTISPECIES: DUF7344 domain-containing protein [Salinibaculum]|uniref:DUF7344 domain-containing protein n=1 Tax=Salinibaculum TaxID=2732368 RepID=UPI0030CCE3E8